MYAKKVKLKDSYVCFYSESGKEMYYFSISEANKRSWKNENYSDWLIHISGKIWSTQTVLIELENILKKHAPKIDWEGSLKEAISMLR